MLGALVHSRGSASCQMHHHPKNRWGILAGSLTCLGGTTDIYVLFLQPISLEVYL